MVTDATPAERPSLEEAIRVCGLIHAKMERDGLDGLSAALRVVLDAAEKARRLEEALEALLDREPTFRDESIVDGKMMTLCVYCGMDGRHADTCAWGGVLRAALKGEGA